jgi:hypothetical protein
MARGFDPVPRFTGRVGTSHFCVVRRPAGRSLEQQEAECRRRRDIAAAEQGVDCRCRPVSQSNNMDQEVPFAQESNPGRCQRVSHSSTALRLC